MVVLKCAGYVAATIPSDGEIIIGSAVAEAKSVFRCFLLLSALCSRRS